MMASASPHSQELVAAAAPASVPSTTPSPSMEPRRKAALAESAEDIVYGSFSGFVGKYIEYPFDTVKVRLQSQPDHLPLRYTGPLDCFRQSIRADGALSLYRGISAPLVGAALENSCLFFFERLGRHAVQAAGLYSRDEPLPLPALFATGCFSGACTSFALNPVELVKCRIQAPVLVEVAGATAAATTGTAASSAAAAAGAASSAPAPASAEAAAMQQLRQQQLRPLPVIRDIFRRQGLRGFWTGQMGTLIREAGGGAAWFGGKETITALFRQSNERRAMSRAAIPTTTAAAAAGSAALLPAELERLRAEPLPLWQQAVAGASAGMSYNFLFFPADTVKSRMQTSPMVTARRGTEAAQQARQRTFAEEAAALWRQAGIKGFYRGCGITVLRSAPSSAFIFTVFDGLKRHLPMQ